MKRLTVDRGFVHEALLYSGRDEFVAATVPFIVDGVEADEPVMVAVSAAKIDLLRSDIGTTADQVLFVDIDQLGSNPARIIPAWQDFLIQWAPANRPVRGIGEPIGPDRSQAALLECQRHEVLLDVAFAGRPDWWLLCPYDVTALQPEVIHEAARSHRYLMRDGEHRSSPSYEPGDPTGLVAPLPPPRAPADALDFGNASLTAVRNFVAAAATRRGLAPSRLTDLLLVVNELATNSVRHGGGSGTVQVWQDGDAIVCDVSDKGVINEPLTGRLRPDRHAEGGRGLWMVNQLCDLVELRSDSSGTVVRVHLTR